MSYVSRIGLVAAPVQKPALMRLWHRIVAARHAAVARQQLAALDDRGLSDIGISRSQAQFEAERSITRLLAEMLR